MAKSILDTLDSIDEIFKNEKKRNNTNTQTSKKERTNTAKSQNNTTQNRTTTKKEKKTILDTLDSIDDIFGETRKTRRIPTVAKPATVGNSFATSLESIRNELGKLQTELDTKTARYTDDYWQRRLDSELTAKNNGRVVDYADPYSYVDTSTNTDAWLKVDNEKKAWNVERADLRKKIMDLTSMQKVYEGMANLSASDYEEYSEKGANIENPSWQESEGVSVFGFDIGAKDIGNIVTFSRENPDAPKANNRYARMTNDEVGVYNYLLAKHGKDKAQEFLDSLDLILETRQGKMYADKLDAIEIPVVEQLATAGYGLYAGAERNIRGWGEQFGDKPHRTTASEVASGYIKESLKDEGIKIGDKSSAYYLYSGAETVGNMLPSIAVSYLTKGLGSAAGLSAGTAGTIGAIAGSVEMGVSASGSAYAQALAEGYDKDQARTYGALVGASEASLQYLLGGISPLGGKGAAKMLTKLAAVDNALLRVAGTAGIKIGGEIAEEELQLFIEPYLRTAIFNEEYNAPEVEEMIETALITAISTGVLEGGSIVSSAKNTNPQLDEINDNFALDEDSINAIIETGLKSNPSTENYRLAAELQAKLERGEDVSRAEVNELYKQNQIEVGMENRSPWMRQPSTLEEAAEALVNDRENNRTGEISEVAEEVENLPAETEKTENNPIMKARNVVGDINDVTKSLLGDSNRTVGVADGQAYVTNSEDILPSPTNRSVFLPVNNVESAKVELGATESNKTSANISKILAQSDFTPIRGNSVDGTIKDVGEVRVFTDEKGREIAIEKNVAEHFEGYNLEATFRGGKPYAIKATDNNGNVAGVAMAVWLDSSGQNYNLVEDNVKTTSNVPFNVMANNNNAEVQSRWMTEAYNKKATGYGQYGVQAITSVMENVPEGLAPRVAMMFNTAYKAGLTNIDTARMTFVNDVQRKAFEAGKKDYIMENADKVENVKNVVSRGDKSGFDRTGAPSDTTSEQLDIVDKLCKALGVKGRFVDTLKGNAVLITNQGEMLIARDFERQVKKGDKTRNVSVVYHAAHELAAHRLMELAPVEGQAFINALYRYMEVDGVTGLAEAKRAAYAKQGVDISLSEAMEEVSANAILELYTYDEVKFAKALDRILNGNDTQAKKGARKFKQILDDIIGKIHKTLGNLGIKKSADLYKLMEVRNLFEKALAKAAEVNKDIAANTTIDENGVVTNSKGEVIAQLNKDGTATFSLKTYDDSGRAELNKWLDDKVKSKALTKAEANEIVEQMEYFYDICKQYEDKYAPFSAWSKAEVVKGLDGKPLMSVVKANGEYKMNLDFSLVCKKRRPLDALYRAMIDDGIMDNIAQLDAVDVARINEIIRSHGLETACTLCFVDAKRYRQFAVADAFVSKYNELVNMLAPEGVKVDRFDFSGKRAASAEGLHTMKDAELKDGINKLNKVLKEYGEKSVVGRIVKHLKAHPNDRKLVTHGDFMDSEGFVRVKKANPKVFTLYNSSKGSGGPKATLPDVQYLGEILKKSNFNPKNAYAVGGVRVQSFSDYIPRLVFDYLQMTADLSAKKLPAHAYSKEEIFVKQFGKTGIKINMSLVPAVAKDGVAPGLDKDGNYVWVDGHTFASDFHDKGSGQRGFELAIKIQNTEGYGQNCGTVAVGVSDAHIEKMLKDENIRMVIPYHLSGLNHFVAQMGNIDQYQDYTKVQNTRYKSGENAGKKITGKDFNFNEAFHRLGDAKAATEEYLAWCEKNDYLPKFDYFAYHEDVAVRENYYKTLIDFAAYDGKGNATPQGPVTMNFPTESDAFGSMKTLIEQGLEADAILEGKKTGKIPEILKEVKAMLGDAAQKNTSEKMKYSIREGLDSDLKSIYKSRPQNGRNELVIGTTSDFLVNTLKADPLKVTMPMSKAYAAMATEEEAKLAGRYNSRLNYHGLGADLLYESLVASENPIAAFVAENEIDEKTGEVIDRSDRIVLVTDKVKDGKNIVVVTEVETPGTVDGGQETVNKDVTVYDRNALLSDISKAITDDRLLHFDKKRSHTISAGKPASNSLGTIQKVDFDANITQFWNNVKWKRAGKPTSFDAATNNKDSAFAEAYKKAEQKSKGKHSLRDSDYMNAVNKGDTETAQKMVDEAAKTAGYTVSAYHGTGADFNIFTEENIGKRNVWGKGFYFGTNKGIADDYASWRESKGGKYRIVSAYLKMDNPYIHRKSSLGTAEEILDRWFPNRWQGSRDLGIGYIQGKLDNSPLDLLQYIAEDNNMEIRDVLREYGYDSIKDGGELVVFSSNQIKSADPVTYDDNGKVIPLSKRFNESNDDIRYSLRDSDGNTLTEAQAEYFKDSKVRDADGNLRIMYHGTPAGGFTEFKLPHYLSSLTSAQGAGYYFTDKANAKQYTKAVNGKIAGKKQLYQVYLNITNPLEISDGSTGAISDAAFRRIMARGNYEWGMKHTDVDKRLSVSRWDSDRLAEMVKVFNGEEILKVMKEELGYDGVHFTDRYGDIWVAWDKAQIKDINNANPTSNVDINYSLRNQNDVSLKDVANIKKAVAKKNADVLLKYVDSGVISTEAYEQLIEEFGAISKGENPHRDVRVPQKTAKDKKVSQTVRTILEAKATPDELVPTIEKMVEDGVFSYDVYTDKQAISDAETYIKEYGWDESLDDWFDAVNKGEVSKETTTMGWALYNNAANTAATTTSETERTSAIKTSLKILDAMVKHQRSAAQALQATRILKKLSPETQLYGIQKSVSALQNEMSERYGDKAPDLKIDEGLAEDFLNAKTPEERAEIEKEILKDIGRQMPSRFIDKWNAWRYLAMLGNVRTHIRNIAGNAGFAPIIATKNLVATAIESAVYRVSGKKTARTKSLAVSGDLLKAAWDDYANVSDMISNGGKYNDSALSNQYIEEGRRIFRTKPLEWARKGNSKLLEMEDMWFAKPHYAYALAQYCKANNITAEQLKKGKALGAAREYAIKEAQKATYRDTNAFSQMVSSWGRGNRSEKNVAKKAFSTVIEGILPFRKTPANILARGVEYSPIGLLKGLSYDLVQVGKGKMSSSQAIDNISAGLTGTGLLALGVYLAAQGLVRGHGEDDEEKDFKELMGHQAYALELPNGKSVTLDWLAPEALPFFVGVNVWETTNNAEEELNLSTILQSISGISEPMLEMSCLQSLNDLFESVGYAASNDTSGLVSVLSSAATSYLMQGLPTIFGQAERTGEEYRMTTYTEKNDFLTGDIQYTLGKASAKIPRWDYNQIPYIDAWGRKEASGTALKRGLNNFLNPAYTSTIETSSMEKELMRLYEKTGEDGVFPTRADKYFTVDEKRKDLTAEEYVRYATLKGEKSYKLVSDLVKSKAYKKLSDTEKAKAIKETYDYANQKAKEAISKYKPETWVSDADKFGSNVGNYISFKTEVSSARDKNGGKISKQEAVDIILDTAQNDTETWNMYLSMYDSEKDLYVQSEGVDGEDYMNFLLTLDEYDRPTKSGAYGSYTQEEAAEAISNVSGISNRDRAILWKSVNKNWKDKNNPWRRYLP